MAASIEEILERSGCDAMQFGGAPSAVDGHCTCLVCARCGHHTGNSHQGHFWTACKVLMRQLNERRDAGEIIEGNYFDLIQRPEAHFCCPDEEHGCEIEQREKEGNGQASPA